MMDRLATIEGQKNFERTVKISSKETIKSMNRLAIIQKEQTVKTTVRFSIK